MENFNVKYYIKLLKKTLSKFEFNNYQQILKDKRGVVWRHDVDFCLKNALKIAKIDNKYKIKAIFFVNSHSEFYNLLEKTNTNIVNKILNLKHEIGIHLDANYYNIKTTEDLIKALKIEKYLFESFFNIISPFCKGGIELRIHVTFSI